MRKVLIAALLFSLPSFAFAQQEYVGRYDAFAGFSYLDSPQLNLEQRGFNTQVGVNVRRWLALGFDYSVQSGEGTLLPRELKPTYEALVNGAVAEAQLGGILPSNYVLYVPFDATTQTFTGGPQLAYRHFKKVTLFVHPSIGAIHEHIALKPHDPFTNALVPQLVATGVLGTTTPSDTTYFYGFGGGADWNATKHIHLRYDVEFVHVFLFSGLLENSRNSVRLSIGPSFNFGKNVGR
jgi:hypothetical protein